MGTQSPVVPATATGRLDQTLAWLGDFISGVAASPPQKALLANALTGLRQAAHEADRRCGCFPSIDLPRAVYAAIADDSAVTVPLSGACALVFLGLDLFDDLADGDRQPHWAGWSASEINLAAATVLSALPSLVLAELDLPADRRARLQQSLSRGLLRMSGGQQADLSLTGARNPSPAEVEASVVGKSGEQLATYAELAAVAAGAPPALVVRYAEIGRELGTAGQLLSDCNELLLDPECRDLAHGTRVLPVAAHLRRLCASKRPAFLDMLEQARRDPAARHAVRERLRDAGEVRRVVFASHVRLAHARRLLFGAGAREPGGTELSRIIGALSASAED